MEYPPEELLRRKDPREEAEVVALWCALHGIDYSVRLFSRGFWDEADEIPPGFCTVSGQELLKRPRGAGQIRRIQIHRTIDPQPPYGRLSSSTTEDTGFRLVSIQDILDIGGVFDPEPPWHASFWTQPCPTP